MYLEGLRFFNISSFIWVFAFSSGTLKVFFFPYGLVYRKLTNFLIILAEVTLEIRKYKRMREKWYGIDEIKKCFSHCGLYTTVLS